MLRFINSLLKRVIHAWLFTYYYDIKIIEGGREPVRAYKNDAGYDLFVSKSINIKPNSLKNVPTGVAVKGQSHNAWIMLTGRSSTLIRHGIIVDTGIIDGDYTGELFIKVYNTQKEEISLYPNMRIGQIIVIPHTKIKFKYVEEFKTKRNERGNKGFGSSGI